MSNENLQELESRRYAILRLCNTLKTASECVLVAMAVDLKDKDLRGILTQIKRALDRASARLDRIDGEILKVKAEIGLDMETGAVADTTA